MAIKSLEELRTYFERGDRPTQEQFGFLIDSLSVGTTGEQCDIEPYHQIISDVAVKKVKPKENSGNIYLTSNPPITHGVDGQQLILYGYDDTDTITLTPTNGLELIANITLKRYTTLFLVYIYAQRCWIEVARRGLGGGESSFDLSQLPEAFVATPTDYLVIHDGTEQRKISKANFVQDLGSQFKLTIEDENNVVSDDVKTINFIGVDVESLIDTNDINRVNIFIPPPNYSSHFNTNDGTTDARINDISTTSRNIALPTAEGTPYRIGDWDGNLPKPTINNTSFTHSTNDVFTITNNTNNTLTVNIYDADNVNMLSSHSVVLNGNLDVTQNNIRIQILDFIQEANRYKARAIFTVNIDSILAPGGRFYIEYKNDTIIDGVYYYRQGPLFYDPDINSPLINSISINETSANIFTKQISGVWYYTLNSQFTVDVTGINYLNDRSYPNIQLNIDGSNYGLTQLNLQGPDLTGWTKQFDDINDSYNKTDWAITQTNFFQQTTTAKVQTRYIDWSAGPWIDSSPLKNILIDTYTDNSLSVFTDFRNESRRYQSDLTTLWDSSQDLSLIDSNTGLQLKNSQLIYPQEDFSIYDPNSSQQPNYSTLLGFRNYISYFFHTGTSHSNGRFQLLNHNLTETILTNQDVIIEISLDGTEWYLLNELYLGGSLSNGSGCRINKDSYNLDLNNQIEFTLGTGKFTDATTGPTGWGIWYKITYKDTSVGKNIFLGSFEIVNWI